MIPIESLLRLHDRTLFESASHVRPRRCISLLPNDVINTECHLHLATKRCSTSKMTDQLARDISSSINGVSNLFQSFTFLVSQRLPHVLESSVFYQTVSCVGVLFLFLVKSRIHLTYIMPMVKFMNTIWFDY